MTTLHHQEDDLFYIHTEYDTGHGLVPCDLVVEILDFGGYYPTFYLEGLWQSDPDKPDHDYLPDLDDDDREYYTDLVTDAIKAHNEQAQEDWLDMRGSR